VNFWAIVVAAGAGRRFGGDKHLSLLGERPLWQWARDAVLESGAAGVVVVGSVPGGVPGGSRRRDSVASGLAALPDGVEFVVVHDAARPLADRALIERVLERLYHRDVDAVVPVVPVRDTLKRVAGDRVAATIDRSHLVAAQTPQGFSAVALQRAHAAGDDDAPDDAALIERIGGVVATVPGDERNLKVTYPGDLEVLEAMVR
jgi:2-C-methyl-D-erythritol 4-phosphate cytidylyltransferase